MATTRSFNDMLNEYLPIDLLKHEWLKRDYFFSNVSKDLGWVEGDIIIPFRKAQASSAKFGSLTDDTDVHEYDYQRGKITTPKELWGTLIFNHADLQIHKGGNVPEKTFLKMLPGQIEDFMNYLKELVSINLLCGPHFAKVTVDGTAGGVLEVDHIDRFEIGQKFTLDDGDSNQADYYVIEVDVNGGTLGKGQVTVSATRGGAAANVSAYTVAQGAKCYHEGILVGGTVTNSFNSVKNILLPAAQGGSDNIYGATKLSGGAFTQPFVFNGAAITATNILEKIFDTFTSIRSRARGNASTVLMSYKHLGSIMKLIETQKGGFKVSANQTSASIYGWTEIKVTTVKGDLTLVGVMEMDDDVIWLVDMSSWKFYSNGLFQKRISPDGNQFYEKRATSGYQYLVDVSLTGELACLAPCKNGAIYGISY